MKKIIKMKKIMKYPFIGISIVIIFLVLFMNIETVYAGNCPNAVKQMGETTKIAKSGIQEMKSNPTMAQAKLSVALKEYEDLLHERLEPSVKDSIRNNIARLKQELATFDESVGNIEMAARQTHDLADKMKNSGHQEILNARAHDQFLSDVNAVNSRTGEKLYPNIEVVRDIEKSYLNPYENGGFKIIIQSQLNGPDIAYIQKGNVNYVKGNKDQILEYGRKKFYVQDEDIITRR